MHVQCRYLHRLPNTYITLLQVAFDGLFFIRELHRGTSSFKYDYLCMDVCISAGR